MELFFNPSIVFFLHRLGNFATHNHNYIFVVLLNERCRRQLICACSIKNPLSHRHNWSFRHSFVVSFVVSSLFSSIAWFLALFHYFFISVVDRVFIAFQTFSIARSKDSLYLKSAYFIGQCHFWPFFWLFSFINSLHSNYYSKFIRCLNF